MPLTPDAPFPKTNGDNIRSKDWNDAVTEVIRLDNAKVNRNGGDTLQGPLSVATRVGVALGATAPSENLHTAGRVRAGNLALGDWPANTNYQFFGVTTLNQSVAGNYALLQGTTGAGGDSGRTMLNSPVAVHFRIGNAERMTLDASSFIVNSNSNPLKFSGAWSAFPDNATDRAEISNDTGTYKTLMLVGNRASGTRKVSVWDRLEVNGQFVVQSNHTIKLGVPAGPYGNDGIRGEPNLWLDAAGTVFIKQGFSARGMDLAEHFPVAAEVQQGHVVVYDEEAGGIRPCEAAYDATAVGIVSEAPACVIGLGAGDAPIALAGRVPCWVDADIAPVRAGDLLVSSPTPGHAQKLVDGERGRGRVIGKALQSLDRGKAQILTFVLAA